MLKGKMPVVAFMAGYLKYRVCWKEYCEIRLEKKDPAFLENRIDEQNVIFYREECLYKN